MHLAWDLGSLLYEIDTDGPNGLLHASWHFCVQIRLRKTKTKQHDFFSLGLNLNASPPLSGKRLFTGIRVGLFKRDWYIGRWSPLSHYRIRPIGSTA